MRSFLDVKLRKFYSLATVYGNVFTRSYGIRSNGWQL